MEETKISKISDQIFFGASPENVLVMDKVKNIGIKYFISLQQNQPDYTNNENILWLPTLNNGVPTFDQLEKGISYIKEKVEQGEKVYVHCRFGCSRAPLLVVAYLISTGMDSREAIEKVRSERSVTYFNKEQEDVIKEFKELNNNYLKK